MSTPFNPALGGFSSVDQSVRDRLKQQLRGLNRQTPTPSVPPQPQPNQPIIPSDPQPTTDIMDLDLTGLTPSYVPPERQEQQAGYRRNVDFLDQFGLSINDALSDADRSRLEDFDRVLDGLDSAPGQSSPQLDVQRGVTPVPEESSTGDPELDAIFDEYRTDAELALERANLQLADLAQQEREAAESGASASEVSAIRDQIRDRYAATFALSAAADAYQRQARAGVGTVRLGNEAAQVASQSGLSARSTGLRSSTEVFQGRTRQLQGIDNQLTRALTQSENVRRQLAPELTAIAEEQANRDLDIEIESQAAARQAELDRLESQRRTAELTREAAERNVLLEDLALERERAGVDEDEPISSYGSTTHSDEEGLFGLAQFRALASNEAATPTGERERFTAKAVYEIEAGNLTRNEVVDFAIARYGNVNENEVSIFATDDGEEETVAERTINADVREIMDRVDALSGFDSAGLKTRKGIFDYAILTEAQRESLASWSVDGGTGFSLDGSTTVPLPLGWLDPEQAPLRGLDG